MTSRSRDASSGLPALDVIPRVLVQDDAASVGIDARGQHLPIVAAATRDDNSLLEPRP
jgi:hypothetical protein